MPQQHKSPGLERSLPSRSLPPPISSGFSLACSPTLPRTSQEMAHGSKLIILSHTLLTNGQGSGEKRPRPPQPAAHESRESRGGGAMADPGRGPRGVGLRGGARARGARAARPDFKGGQRGKHFRGTCSDGGSLLRRGWDPPPPGSPASPRPAGKRRAEGGGAAAVI